MGTNSILLLFEAFDLISNTTIIGVLYGIAFSLYCLCAWSLYLKLQNPDKCHRARFSLGCISLLFLCGTGILVVDSRMIQVAYINHADFPGGPFVYEGIRHSTTIPYFAISGVLDLIIGVLTMAIQIRRLWIIWSGTRYAVVVTILPVLLLLAYIALDIPTFIADAFVPLGQLGISERSNIAMVTAMFAILSSFTLLVTGLITARLLLARRKQTKVMGMSEAASPYLSIVALLVESYALESAWSLATAITFSLQTPSGLMFQGNDSTIKIITYFLIVYRVETGRGWTKQTERKLTSLQWNHGAQTATDEVSGIRSRVPATVTVAVVGSLPDSESAV